MAFLPEAAVEQALLDQLHVADTVRIIEAAA
jgi:hypothetical protein